jgi:hypothetical protein
MEKITCVEDIDCRIKEIWNSPYIKELPSWVKDRRYRYADPIKAADLLITGINPSFRPQYDNENLPDEYRHGPATANFTLAKYDNYWGPLSKMIDDELRGRFDYLDIFHFWEMDQNKLRKEILSRGESGWLFIADELNLTQHIIEDIIKPKLILVKNKESWAYWGKVQGFVWMGYVFDKIKDFPCGELCKIVGLQSDGRITPEIEETCLKGNYVLFSKHINQYTKREERPTPELLNSILKDNF